MTSSKLAGGIGNKMVETFIVALGQVLHKMIILNKDRKNEQENLPKSTII